MLRSIEDELYEREDKKPITDKVVFSVKYFKEVTELRKLVHSTSEDIKQLCGDVQILFALRRLHVRHKNTKEMHCPLTSLFTKLL